MKTSRIGIAKFRFMAHLLANLSSLSSSSVITLVQVYSAAAYFFWPLIIDLSFQGCAESPNPIAPLFTYPS